MPPGSTGAVVGVGTGLVVAEGVAVLFGVGVAVTATCGALLPFLAVGFGVTVAFRGVAVGVGVYRKLSR